MDGQQVTPYTAVDLDAPIVPDVGLGGMRLRDPITAISMLVNKLPTRYTATDWLHLIPLWVARYTLGYVEVSADVRTGQIFIKIIARQGYQGRLFEKIGVGMVVADAMRLEPRLFYNEGSEALEVRGTPGVVLEVAEVDPDTESVLTMPIHAISVYRTDLASDYR